MNHEEVKGSLYDYLKGECGDKAPEIKKHLNSCPECRLELLSIRKVRSVFASSIQAVPKAARPPVKLPGFLPFFRPVPSIAAAMLLLLVIFSGINFKSHTERKGIASFLSDSYSSIKQDEASDPLVSDLLDY